MLKGIIFSLVLVASFTFVSCGGGSGSDSVIEDTVDVVDTVEETTLTFPYPDLESLSEENIALAKSLEETHAALLQATLLINGYIFVDPIETDFATFELRRQKAIDATRVLIEKVDIALEKEAEEAANNIVMASQKSLDAQLSDAEEAPDSNTIVSLTPIEGTRPVKDVLDTMKIGAEESMDILSGSTYQLPYEDYIEPSKVKVSVWKERLNAAFEIVNLGAIAIIGGAAVMTPGLSTVAIVGAASTGWISFTGQTLKMAVALRRWGAAENGAVFESELPSYPTIFVPVVDVAEVVTVVTMTNGYSAILYANEKLKDLSYSGFTSITFGAHDITANQDVNNMEVYTALLNSSNLDEFPTVAAPSKYITVNGESFVVDGLPTSYRISLAPLTDEDWIQLFDMNGSCPMTYNPLLDPDNDYAYNVNINDIDKDGIFENRFECSYYPSGSIYTDFPYIDDKLNGDKKRYYETGILEVYTHYVDDIMHGTTRWYHESGNLAAETLWVDGVMNGLKTVYYDSDQVYYTMMIIDGKAEGEVREYYETGELHWIVPYVNDQVNGVTKEFYLSEKLHWETTYVAGIKEGPSTGYFETGEKQFIMNYVNDKLDGHFFELDIYGNVIVCYLYEDDVVVDDDFCHDQFTI